MSEKSSFIFDDANEHWLTLVIKALDLTPALAFSFVPRFLVTRSALKDAYRRPRLGLRFRDSRWRKRSKDEGQDHGPDLRTQALIAA